MINKNCCTYTISGSIIWSLWSNEFIDKVIYIILIFYLSSKYLFMCQFIKTKRVLFQSVRIRSCDLKILKDAFEISIWKDKNWLCEVPVAKLCKFYNAMYTLFCLCGFWSVHFFCTSISFHNSNLVLTSQWNCNPVSICPFPFSEFH